MGIECKNENYEKYTVKGGEKWQGFEYHVPLDWSAALYPIVAALVTAESEVTIPGMDYEDSQGDKELVEVLRRMGGDITIEGDVVNARSSRLKGMEIDCNNFIDQIPLVAVIGALAEGQTRITNAEIGRKKECDRLAVSEMLLKSMGAEIEQTDDGLLIQGGKLKGAVLDSYKDHRMVMAMGVAAMAAEGDSLITDCQCVKKTFAKFPEQMAAIGAEIRKD
jgi:3-phosphoshikimate 1-carboxyvinyltransferase